MIWPLGWWGAANTLGRHCYQMAQRRCRTLYHSPFQMILQPLAAVQPLPEAAPLGREPAPLVSPRRIRHHAATQQEREELQQASSNRRATEIPLGSDQEMEVTVA